MDYYLQTRTRKARTALAATALPLAALMLALTALAAVGCGSDNSREIKRADISDLPTPSGGEIFAAEGDVQPTPASADDNGSPSETGFGAGGGGGGPFGGGGFGDFERIVQENPEIASLMQKAQAGTATEADAVRLEQLLTELFQPGGALANEFALPTIAFGTISSVDVQGKSVTLAPEQTASAPADVDAVAMTADQISATVGDNTAMLHAQTASLADVVDGTTIDIIAVRNEQGVIIAKTVTVLEPRDASGSGAGAGAGAGFFGGGLGGDVGASALIAGDADDIPIQGRVTNVIEGRIHVEAGQGPLRVTVTEDTHYYRFSGLELADVPADATALLMTVGEGDAVLLFVGPEELLRPVAENGFGGPGRAGLQGPGGFGQQRNNGEGIEGQDGQQQPGPGGPGRRPGGGLRRFAR